MIYHPLMLFCDNIPSGEITFENDALSVDAAQSQSTNVDLVNTAVAEAVIDTGDSNTPDAADSQTSKKSRREIYDEFIRSHKDLFAEDTQKIINRRFKEAKEQEAELKLANERIKELEKKITVTQICPPSDEFIASHPDFNLEKELENKTFSILYNNGADCLDAYNAAHANELIEKARDSAHREAIKATLDNVRARGARIHESASASLPGITIKHDVSRLSRLERAEIARRVMAGEKVSFT